MPDILSYLIPSSWKWIPFSITKNPLDLFDKTIRVHFKQFGSMFKWNFAHASMIIIAEPKFAKFIASKDGIALSKDTFTEQVLRDLFGEAILMATNQPSWQRLHNLCSHGFTEKSLRHACQVTNQMVDEFFATVQNQQFNADYFGLLTMDVLGKAIFSIPLDALKSKGKHAIVQSISHIFDSIIFLSIFPSSFLRKTLFFLNSNNRQLVSWIKQVVHQRLQNQQCQDNSFEDDILSQLIQSGVSKASDASPHTEANEFAPLSEQELVSNIINFFLCGFEMMGRSLLFACYLLAKHKNIQEEAQTLIDCNLLGATPTDSDLCNLNLIHCIFAETMRLYPVAPVLWRESTQNFLFQGTVIPKGFYVVYPITVVSRNEKQFSEPDEFIPHRFETQDWSSDALPLLSTFGEGPRKCLGRHFAKTTFIITLVRILQQFTITLADSSYEMETEVKSGILKPKEPLFLRLIPRNAHTE